jgi:hypothetical protein
VLVINPRGDHLKDAFTFDLFLTSSQPCSEELSGHSDQLALLNWLISASFALDTLLRAVHTTITTPTLLMLCWALVLWKKISFASGKSACLPFHLEITCSYQAAVITLNLPIWMESASTPQPIQWQRNWNWCSQDATLQALKHVR